MIKNHLLRIFLLFGLASLIYSCDGTTTTASNPDGIGEIALNLLKGFDFDNEKRIKAHLPTVDEFFAIGKAAGGKEENFSEAYYAEFLTTVVSDMNDVRKAAEDDEILWSKIKFDNYEYEEEEKQGVAGSEGYLFFSHNDQKYRIVVMAVKVNSGKWKIIRMGELQRHNDQK